MLKIDQPRNFSNPVIAEVINLIVKGGQIKAPDAKVGVHRANMLATLEVEGQVVATACFKNPRLSYTKHVFRDAKVDNESGHFLHELGYIVTRPGFEGRGFCQRILHDLFRVIKDQPMFATTRKPEMSHILKKIGFEQAGVAYKKDLQLFVYQPATSFPSALL